MGRRVITVHPAYGFGPVAGAGLSYVSKAARGWARGCASTLSLFPGDTRRSKLRLYLSSCRSQPRLCLSSAAGYLPADLQVLATCFTLSTVRVCEPAAPPAIEPELGLLPAALEVEPLIWTSCPTCSVSFEVSP